MRPSGRIFFAGWCAITKKPITRVTRKIGFFVIAHRPAKKTLPDGRNAHLIQEGPAWWLPKLESRFKVSQVKEMSGEFAVVVRPL